MRDFIKKHKKILGAFVVAVIGAIATLVTGLVNGCTSSGMWKADFQKQPEYVPAPIYRQDELPSVNVTYPFAPPKSDISEVGGFENE